MNLGITYQVFDVKETRTPQCLIP